MFTSVPTSRIQHGIDDIADRPPSETTGDAVLYAGKIQRSKGLETLFEAASAIPDVTVHVCGGGPMEEEVADIASNSANVTYHGFVPEDRLQALRREVDAAIVPSVWMENSPLVIYESFATGLPVIASDIGGIPELVEHGVQGYLFEPENDAELAAHIGKIVDADSTQMRENALAWARRRTMEQHVDELEETYGF
jgi:glycosyltransferase involved in cell wall biosynthesis